MPFKSHAQKEYLRINEPEIYERWMRDYGDGYVLDAETFEDNLTDCSWCGAKPNFVVYDLPIGPRAFCSEKHFARFVGLEEKEPGYYGFDAQESGTNCESCGGFLKDCIGYIDGKPCNQAGSEPRLCTKCGNGPRCSSCRKLYFHYEGSDPYCDVCDQLIGYDPISNLNYGHKGWCKWNAGYGQTAGSCESCGSEPWGWSDELGYIFFEEGHPLSDSDYDNLCLECLKDEDESVYEQLVNQPAKESKPEPQSKKWWKFWNAEDWGGDPEGTLAKALAKARAHKPKPLKLLHRNQTSLQDFEAELDGIELPVCCGAGMELFTDNGDIIITCQGKSNYFGGAGTQHYCRKSKRLSQLQEGVLWDDCSYCGSDLWDDEDHTFKTTDGLVCKKCYEEHYKEEDFEAEYEQGIDISMDCPLCNKTMEIIGEGGDRKSENMMHFEYYCDCDEKPKFSERHIHTPSCVSNCGKLAKANPCANCGVRYDINKQEYHPITDKINRNATQYWTMCEVCHRGFCGGISAGSSIECQNQDSVCNDCAPFDTYGVYRAESNSPLFTKESKVFAIGLASGIVATIFGNLLSEFVIDRFREDPELSDTEQNA